MNFRILFFVILIWSGWARRRPKQARERFKDDEGDVVEEDEEIDWSNELHRMRESGNRAKKKSITDYLQPPTVLDPEAAGGDLALAQFSQVSGADLDTARASSSLVLARIDTRTTGIRTG